MVRRLLTINKIVWLVCNTDVYLINIGWRFPEVMFVFVCCVQFWNIVKLMATPSTAPALFGGGLLGYVMYDCTHYYLHHGQPKTEVPQNLKVKILQLWFTIALWWLLWYLLPNKIIFFSFFPQKYHLNHHFRIQDKGFGITSSLWDKIFGTLPPSKMAAKSM